MMQRIWLDLGGRGATRKQSNPIPGMKLIAGASLIAIATAPMAAFAQSQATAQPQAASPAAETPPSDAGDAEQGADIVVTGTLIRGIAPTGSNSLNLSEETIRATGKSSINDVLSFIPQITNTFNSVPTGTGGIASPTVRPSLRSLGGAGGATTLLLLNGRRMVGAGILQTAADPSIIPPAVLQRVEVVPDGGSSIYGSDAIGGVINFITRKSFDGLEISGRYGVGNDFDSREINVTGGVDWTGGSALLAYSHAEHGNILGIDRDFVTQNNLARGGSDFRGNACAPGNVTVGGISYALPAREPRTTNRCDTADFATVYPDERRDTVFGSISHSLTSGIEFTTTAYWSRRRTDVLGAQALVSGTIRRANPYFQAIGTEASQTVAFSLSPVFGPSLETRQEFTSYGVTPSVEIDLPQGWQLTVSGNYGHSDNTIVIDNVNQTLVAAALAGTTTATALNPYDPAATNAAVLTGILDYATRDFAKQDLREARAILDGSLFSIGGGDVRLAVGTEYHYEKIAQTAFAGSRIATPVTARGSAKRDVESLYGEIYVPLVGASNGMPGLRALDLSASVRYDSYSDFGSTTNPKIGISYKPFDALVIRANYGTSFQAPSIADVGGGTDTQVVVSPNSPFRPAGTPASNVLRSFILVAGGNPELTPQSADTWQVGADLKPMRGLSFNVTYWNIAFTNAIQTPPFFTPSFFSDPSYAAFYVTDPTLAQAEAATAGQRIIGAPNIASLFANGVSPYIIIDARRRNLGAVNLDGLDFNAAYTATTSFGSVNGSVGGTYILNRKTRATAASPFVDNLQNGTGRINLVGVLGAQVGAARVQATARHSGGYPIRGVFNQTRVDSYTTADLVFGYAVNRGALRDLDLTLNIDNVFDQDPPYLNNSLGYGNGFTLGRTFTFGVRKRF